MNEREHTIAVVDAALPPLQRIDELYNTATNLAQQLTAARTTSTAKKKNHASLYSAIAAIVTFAVFERITLSIGSKAPSAFAFILATIITFAAAVFVYFFVKKLITKESPAVTNLAAQNEVAINSISQEIENVATAYSEQINALPRDYRYYYAVSYFENLLANGRADSMKEAINLFEVHLHQLRMENMHQQMLYSHEQQTRMLAAIEQNSRDTVRAVNVNTAFNVLQFMSRI